MSANKEEWPGRSAIWSVQDESGREAAPSPELTGFVGQRAKKRRNTLSTGTLAQRLCERNKCFFDGSQFGDASLGKSGPARDIPEEPTWLWKLCD